jgi:hypothetical protein
MDSEFINEEIIKETICVVYRSVRERLHQQARPWWLQPYQTKAGNFFHAIYTVKNVNE